MIFHNLPAGMRVEDWYSQNGITKANYYYRLRKVRERACLQNIPDEIPAEVAVPVPAEFPDGRRYLNRVLAIYRLLPLFDYKFLRTYFTIRCLHT